MCEDLLTKELWARAPYHVKVFYENDFYNILGISCGRVVLVKPVMSTVAATPLIKEVKLYLRPMSSMTEEEDKDFALLQVNFYVDGFLYPIAAANMVNWLNEHHFDYCGLIEKGIAIKAPEDMYR